MKITTLELENVKRVKAVSFSPNPNGLTVLGGKNGQGKTSVLDAIAWALGGDTYKPSNAQRDGSMVPPKLHIVLDNGIVVDRNGKNSSLTVTDPTGKRAGQKLLDEFVEKLALDLPKFMQQNSKDKARTLLKIIGMEEQVRALDDREAQAYNRRRTVGQMADQKKKYAEGLASFPEAPDEPLSAGDLIEQQQAILQQNAENRLKRSSVQMLEAQNATLNQQRELVRRQIESLNKQLQQVESEIDANGSRLESLKAECAQLVDASTEELEMQIQQIDQINVKVRANMEKRRASDEAAKLEDEYANLSAEIESIRSARTSLLNDAGLPLPELSVEQGELLYRGKAWDCMSSAEQLRVSVAIVRAINPKCGFVLVDKTEMMDEDTLREFGAWLEAEGLQAICTRVGKDGVCELIIEDGMIAETAPAEEPSKWQKGVF